MSKYHELTVNFILSEKEMECLKEINQHFQAYVNQDGRRPFADQTIEDTFSNVMLVGSRPYIKEKFGFAMLQMGMMSLEEWRDKKEKPIEEWKTETKDNVTEKADEKER